MNKQRDMPETEIPTLLLGDDMDDGNRSQLAEMLKAGTDGFVREAYRLPMAQVSGIRISMDGREYDVMDLGLGGVRFLLDRRDRYIIGDSLDVISLPLGDKSLTVKGEVVHVSLTPDKSVHCGVRFIFANDEDRRILDEFIQQALDGLFE